MIEDYKGYKIEIEQDEDAESPRDWDNLGTMVMFHGRYNLPIEADYKSEDFEGWYELEKQIKHDFGKCLMLPVYMYDHSGVSLKTTPYNDSFDSGRVGVIFVTKDKIMKEYGRKRMNADLFKKVQSVLEGEVETYSQYLNGEVYGFTIVKKVDCDKCGIEHGEPIDSCWGFYGQDSALEEAKAVVDGILNNPVVVNKA